MAKMKKSRLEQGAMVPSEGRKASSRRRFFISYAHGCHDDETLARWLCEQLTSTGQEVFLDERMSLGTNWKEAIPHTIGNCDVFIVLLSANSVRSDMLQEEVLIAREHLRAHGRPLFAPVRVKYSGELGYVLSAYLRCYQWKNWNAEDDSQELLSGLLAMVNTEITQNLAVNIADSIPPQTPRGKNLGDIAALGGAMAADHPMYIPRDSDGDAVTRMKCDGQTIVVLGARQTGKSSLLNRCLEAVHSTKRFAAVDFSRFDTGRFASLADLLRELAKSLLREFRLIENVDHIAGPNEMTWFIEDKIIRAVGGKIALVIDEVDKVFEQPYRSDFFGMIRSWHNSRANLGSNWKNVDIVLAISTEPQLLIVDQSQSPFNVTLPIRLKWFTLAQVKMLNERYGMPLDQNALVLLHEHLGGHPFLTQLALFEVSRSSQPDVARFLLDSLDQDSAFGPHLHTLLHHLKERPELKLIECFQQIVRYGTSPSNDATYRLQAAGLVRREGDRVLPANVLYARFFERAR